MVSKCGISTMAMLHNCSIVFIRLTSISGNGILRPKNAKIGLMKKNRKFFKKFFSSLNVFVVNAIMLDL